ICLVELAGFPSVNGLHDRFVAQLLHSMGELAVLAVLSIFPPTGHNCRTARPTRFYRLKNKRHPKKTVQFFCPDPKPTSLSPRRKDATLDLAGSGEPACTNPIAGINGCCARAASGHIAAVPPSSVIVMKSRRFIDGNHQPGPRAGYTGGRA